MNSDLPTWLCCLPALLLAFAIAFAIGSAPASPDKHAGEIHMADDAEELNCFARLGLLDGKADDGIDLRDSRNDS